MSTPSAPTVARGPVELPKGLLIGVLVLIGLGLVGLVIGLIGDPVRAWQVYLVNYLFFLGIGAGGVLFTCVINLTSGRWGRPVKRVAEGLGAFLPVALVLFLAMIPGLTHIVPWIKQPYGPSWWNTLSLLIAREILALLILNGLGLWILYTSVRADLGQANERGGAYQDPVHCWITRDWRGADVELAAARMRLLVLSPVYTFAYAVTLTIVAMDLIMSLKPNWISTLIGGYYFAGSFYVALAGLLVATIWARRRFGLQAQIGPTHLADIAKLTMAFGIVSGDFFYCQLMMIWYGNLPHETSFLIDRMVNTPWRVVGILVMLGCFLLPLLVLLSRKLKEMSAPMVAFGTLVLFAMWWERFLSLGPSITGKERIPFGPLEILVTAGFVGLLLLVFTTFLHRVPAVIENDPVLDHLEEPT